MSITTARVTSAWSPPASAVVELTGSPSALAAEPVAVSGAEGSTAAVQGAPAGSMLPRPATDDVRASRSPVVERDVTRLPQARLFRGPEALTKAERRAGLHMNRITLELAGNSHFPGWWNVVQHDTSVVVVQGKAYAGRTVDIGGERYQDAAIIYLRRDAGFREQTTLDVAGANGEEVRVLYYRLGAAMTGTAPTRDARGNTVGAFSMTVSPDGKDVKVSVSGASALIGGDAHFRDVKFVMQPTHGGTRRATVPVGGEAGKIVHYQPDPYGWGHPGDRDGALGGAADASKAAARTVDPMTPGGR